MRDANRIGRILEKLRAAWLSSPDMRLGQLVVNLTQQERAVLYNVEDDVLERHLDRLNECGEWPSHPPHRSLAW